MTTPKKDSSSKVNKSSSAAKATKTSVSTRKRASKNTTTKTAAAKKVSTVASRSTQKPARFFSWDHWRNTFNQATACWKNIIWNYVLVLILTLSLQLLGVLVFASLLLLLVGGVQGLENIFANLTVGTLPDIEVMAGFFGLLLVWGAYAVYIASLSKITYWSLVNCHENKQKPSILNLFFVESNQQVLSFIWLNVMVFAYITWPILILLGFFIAWDLTVLFLEFESSASLDVINVITPIVVVLGVCVSLGYVVFATIRMLFAVPVFIKTKLKAAAAMTKAKTITNGIWWYTFLMWGLFVLMLYALNTIMVELAYLDPIVLMEAENASQSLRLTDLLAFLISLFIFGPITTAFQYYLMIQAAKNQSVKL